MVISEKTYIIYFEKNTEYDILGREKNRSKILIQYGQ